ncbi:MAG: AMED_5909 family protein [Sciscionella sp.]
MAKAQQVTSPQTLAQAHEDVQRRRPAPQSDVAQWLEFHRHNAALYAQIADIDRGHHHEALYWVRYEQRNAEEHGPR